jgi:hypothetical protein
VKRNEPPYPTRPRDFIRWVLDTRGNSTAGEIVAAMRAAPEFSDRFQANEYWAHRLLVAMRQQRYLLKEGSLYKPPTPTS